MQARGPLMTSRLWWVSIVFIYPFHHLQWQPRRPCVCACACVRAWLRAHECVSLTCAPMSVSVCAADLCVLFQNESPNTSRQSPANGHSSINSSILVRNPPPTTPSKSNNKLQNTPKTPKADCVSLLSSSIACHLSCECVFKGFCLGCVAVLMLSRDRSELVELDAGGLQCLLRPS